MASAAFWVSCVRTDAVLLLCIIAAGPTSSGCAARPAMGPRVTDASCRIEDPVAPAQWIAPQSARDSERLDFWCASVGPLFTREGAGRGVTDMVAIVSWNIHAGAGRIPELVARLRSGNLTGGRSVTHFVLLLQEAVRALDTSSESLPGSSSGVHTPSLSEQQDIQHLSAALDAAVVYAPAMRHGSGARDRGNAILSTVPLRDLSIVELPFERQRRLAVVATASGQTSRGVPWRLRVASAHFDTGLMMDRGGAEAARVRQAHALADVLSPSPDPLVVGGDFNTAWPREPALAVLARAFPDARQPDLETWRGPLGLRRQLDYVFARLRSGTAQVSRVPERMGSDHHALLITIPAVVLTDGVKTSAAAPSTPFALDHGGGLNRREDP